MVLPRGFWGLPGAPQPGTSPRLLWSLAPTGLGPRQPTHSVRRVLFLTWGLGTEPNLNFEMALEKTGCDLSRATWWGAFQVSPPQGGSPDLDPLPPFTLDVLFRTSGLLVPRWPISCPLGRLTCAAPTTREPLAAHDLVACYGSVPKGG